MKKHNYLSVSWSILSTVLIFAFVMMPLGVFGASTIGTNMSTTGTFTQTVGSTTAARFQNAAGTINSLYVDTTNTRVGVGAAPSTTFEVQGTASASYFYTTGTLQVGALFSTATVAYSRFGAGTTGYSTFVDAADDFLITGALEVDGKAFFDGTASVAGRFEAMGVASSSQSFVSQNIVVGANVASSSTAYVAEFGGSSTGTVSFLFAGGNSSSTGSCFQLKDTAGIWAYARITAAGAWSVTRIKCR